jgi:hypothetical protein
MEGGPNKKQQHLIRTLQGTFLPRMVPIHPVVLEKKFILHISHRVAMLKFNDLLLRYYMEDGIENCHE